MGINKILIFFRPSLWKIILTFLIPFYLTWTWHYAMVEIGDPAPGWWYQISFFPFPLPVVYYMVASYSGVHPIFTVWESVILFGLNYILPLIINYLISCFIVYLFVIFKKRAA